MRAFFVPQKDVRPPPKRQKEILEEVTDALAQSENGAKLLDSLKEKGVKFTFTEHAGMNAAYNPANKTIYMNYATPVMQARDAMSNRGTRNNKYLGLRFRSPHQAVVASMVGTIAHEGYHALQDHARREAGLESGAFDKQTLLTSMSERHHSECGADVFAATVVDEMDKKGAGLVRQAFQLDPRRARALEDYRSGLKAGKPQTEAMKGAARGWSSKLYARFHVGNLKKAGQTEIPPEKLVETNFPSLEGGSIYTPDEARKAGETLQAGPVREMLEAGRTHLEEKNDNKLPRWARKAYQSVDDTFLKRENPEKWEEQQAARAEEKRKNSLGNRIQRLFSKDRGTTVEKGGADAVRETVLQPEKTRPPRQAANTLALSALQKRNQGNG